VFKCLFKRPTPYFLKATRPCAVAYGYARIRRLVRLGAARYLDSRHCPSVIGFSRPVVSSEVHQFYQSGIPMPALDGSCAQGAFGRAGLLDPRSTNLRTAATPLV